VYDTESGKRTLSIPITEQRAFVTVMNFTPDGSQLIGRVTIAPKLRLLSSSQVSLKFWDTATGKEAGSIAPEHNGENFSWPATFSPDGRTYALGNSRGKRAELYLIDVAGREISRTVDLGEKRTFCGQAFSPDGRWIAVATQRMPEDRLAAAYASVQDLPQPRIHLIEAATGKVRETMVAPQSFIASLCFSPDGKTLASGGPGRVLLWDLSTPPGELAK